MALGNPLEAFQWGGGGQKLSPSEVAQKRAIAQALMSKQQTPQNVGQGLNRVGEALLYNSMNSKANEAESAGNAAAAELFAGLQDGDNSMQELMGAMSDPYLQGNKGQSAIVQALMNQEMQKSDPSYQMGLEKAQLELDALRNPTVKTPTSVQEFEYGQKNPEFAEYQSNLKKSGATNVSVNGESDAFNKEFDKKEAQTFSDIQDSAIQAGRTLTQIDQLQGALKGVDTGGGAVLAQMAGNFGIQTGGLSEIQAVTALINQMVPAQRQPGSGPMSDADLELFKQSVPRLINTPGGNDRILSAMREINEYTVRQGEIVNMTVNKEITREEARNLFANMRRDAKESFSDLLSPDESSEQPAPQQGETIDGYIFKGGDPADQNNWERVM